MKENCNLQLRSEKRKLRGSSIEEGGTGCGEVEEAKSFERKEKMGRGEEGKFEGETTEMLDAFAFPVYGMWVRGW